MLRYSTEFPDRPLCAQCGVNLAKRKRGGGFKERCSTCQNGMSRHDRKYTRHKKTYCENLECTSTIIDSCMLTVDHVDGNKQNDDPSNFLTLCHNCHALKTKLNREYLNVAYRSVDGV